MTTSAGKKVPWHLVVPMSVILTICLANILAMYVTSEQPQVAEFSGPTMGTRYSVSVATDGKTANWPPDVEVVQRQVDERLAEINRRMSTYDPESELSRFNRLNSSEWFVVSAETAEVVAAALEIAERTSGAFDPTVGPIVNLWGFGPDKGRTDPPSDDMIKDTLARVGYEKVSVRIDPPALKKSISEVYLDLSGIAKGYASDAISELLDELGFSNTMVEIGGEVRTRGTKAGGMPWRIGVEQPEDRDRHIHTAVNLLNAGMATSGDYRIFFQHEGVRYSHTIDAVTGRPVQHDLAAVSVIAATCMEADALATALLVMGDEKGYDWCLERDISAMFLVRHGEQIIERATPKFQKRIVTK